jgi:hypothetical protein
MDRPDLDALARRVAKRGGTRRWALAGLTGIGAALTGALPDADARCKKKKRCGKDCCNRDRCFAKTVDDNTGSPTKFGCCPRERLCRSELPNWQDQCCYPQMKDAQGRLQPAEICDPQLPTKDPSADSICCRPCGGVCCKSGEECNSAGQCVLSNTARLPRYRKR